MPACPTVTEGAWPATAPMRARRRRRETGRTRGDSPCPPRKLAPEGRVGNEGAVEQHHRVTVAAPPFRATLAAVAEGQCLSVRSESRRVLGSVGGHGVASSQSTSESGSHPSAIVSGVERVAVAVGSLCPAGPPVESHVNSTR